jgi:hypothetical protein
MNEKANLLTLLQVTVPQETPLTVSSEVKNPRITRHRCQSGTGQAHASNAARRSTCNTGNPQRLA